MPSRLPTKYGCGPCGACGAWAGAGCWAIVVPAAIPSSSAAAPVINAIRFICTSPLSYVHCVHRAFPDSQVIRREQGDSVRIRILFATVLLATLSGGADAHFVLVSPAASLVQNRLGDPQKTAPCGGVAANPGRGTLANPGVPSGAVTNVKGGTSLPLLVQESIFHPGHYRVALARTVAQLPPDPAVTTATTERGVRSQSAVIQHPPVAPVLLDGIFAHTERPTQNFEGEIPIPNINCPNCVLQVIEFMAEHPGIGEGGHSYHHCAILNITADPAKPIDKRW